MGNDEELIARLRRPCWLHERGLRGHDAIIDAMQQTIEQFRAERFAAADRLSQLTTLQNKPETPTP